MSGEPETLSFWTGLYRFFQSVFSNLVGFLAQCTDWLLRCFATLGQWLAAGMAVIFEFFVTLITRMLALPAVIIGLILSIIGAVFSLGIYAIVASTDLPQLAQLWMQRAFSSLGLDGFFYFLINYLAFDNLIAFGLIVVGFSFTLMAFGFLCRIVWKVIPSL